MKLFIVLSLIACSYGDKLDRTYLPPPSAASAGGSPGALTAPFGSPSDVGLEQPGFGSQYRPGPQGSAALVPQSSPSGFGRPATPSRFGSPSGAAAPSSFGQLSSKPTQSGFEGSAQGADSFGQSPAAPSTGNRFGSAKPTGQAGFGPASSQQSLGGPSQYEQPAETPEFGSGQQATAQAGFGQAPSGQAGFGQAPSTFNQGQAGPFGGQPQQPERPQAEDDRNAQILRYDSENDGEKFAYSFETSNGITAEESGVATNGVQAEGAFAYTGDDGQRYSVTYTADERGYLPQGDHLPTPPPIPDEILRSIEENAKAAAAGTQEGAYNPEEDEAESPQQYNSGVAPAYQDQDQNRFGIPDGNELEPTSAEEPNKQYNRPQSQGNGIAPSSSIEAQGLPQQYRPQAQGSFAARNGNKPTTPQGQAQGPRQPTRFGTNGNAPSTGNQNAQYRPQIQGSSQPFGRPNGNAVAPASPQGAPYQYNRPQANRPGSQFGASTGNELAASPESPAQQYNRPQGSPQGAPQPFASFNGNAPAGSVRPQASGQQFNRPQATRPAQQYGAPSGNGASKPGSPQGANQQYNRPEPNSRFGGNSNDAPSGSPSQNSEDSSYQYNRPQNAGPFGSNSPRPFASNQGPQRSNQLASPQNQGSPGFPSRTPNQRPQANRPQYNQQQFGSGTENADESGYDYNRPQGTPFNTGFQARPQGNQARPQQNKPESQQYSNQPSGAQQFRPDSRPQPQGFRPSQGSDAAAVSQGQGPFAGSQPSGQIRPSPGSRVPMAQSAPYQYNRPAAPSQESQSGSQSFAPQGNQPQGQFGGPRQPPSFDPEEGYKY